MKPTTKEQREQLKRLTEPVMEWLSNNFNPYVYVVIKLDRAELLEGQCSYVTDEFVKD